MISDNVQSICICLIALANIVLAIAVMRGQR